MLAHSSTIVTGPLICRGSALVGFRTAPARDGALWFWLMCPQCRQDTRAREHSPWLSRVVPPIHQCRQMIIPNLNCWPGPPAFLNYSCPHLILRWKRHCWPHLSRIQYWCAVVSASICLDRTWLSSPGQDRVSTWCPAYFPLRFVKTIN